MGGHLTAQLNIQGGKMAAGSVRVCVLGWLLGGLCWEQCGKKWLNWEWGYGNVMQNLPFGNLCVSAMVWMWRLRPLCLKY